mgnify:CR=1 FL=1
MAHRAVEREIILSIITPYYNTLSQIKNLNSILSLQLTDAVEWIIIDDGCNETELDSFNAKVIHLPENSGGASIPRNIGLDNAVGKYITFIDSDDLVTSNYIKVILNKINNETFDYCFISWKGDQFKVIIKDNPPSWNCCVWNCIYKKSLIGDTRFNPKYKMAEDFDFNQKVRGGKRANITDILYIYNNTPNSLVKQGQLYNNKFKE